MDFQRLRNLTTGRLHTEMAHIYQDIEYLTGMEGIMTHMLPRAMNALELWLRKMVPDHAFWDGEWDTQHTGRYVLRPMNEDERAEFTKLYREQPNPLEGKDVIAAVV